MSDDKLPAVLMHVRLTSMLPVEALEAIRTDLQAFLDSRAELWGLRVKRRLLTREQFAELFEVYEARAALTERRAVAVKKKAAGPRPRREEKL
jgi:hypothetical protein